MVPGHPGTLLCAGYGNRVPEYSEPAGIATYERTRGPLKESFQDENLSTVKY